MSQPAAYSHLAAREVAAVLAMTLAQQRSFFEGATNPATGREERGVVDIRGAAAVEAVEADMHRLEDARRAAKR